MIWEPMEQLEKKKRVIAHAPNVRKRDVAIASDRILYVNYNPATLIRDEQLFMRAGCEVDTVFGTDGLMARGPVAADTPVLIDEACPAEDRKKLLRWLAVNFTKLDILSAAWLHKRAARR